MAVEKLWALNKSQSHLGGRPGKSMVQRGKL